MGHHKKIGYDFFPEQNLLDANVIVYFHYDMTRTLKGKIVRRDIGKPGMTIIRLEDGRYVLDTECCFFADESVSEQRYGVREVSLDSDTKHIVIGAKAARPLLDLDNYPKYVIQEDEMITEQVWNKLIRQGRNTIEIKELIKQ